ncbi:SRPBCC family protein [Georgenia sp. SYP-B2076]|uniref:SRPBCC family protein n=1 Tax=Georgenia sp. SYP-B2076 TaxID=2495881 RepID=UPI000F8D042E|nr:SRPBCC family protein [Georgenia sp. SYP-B2076]
MTSTSTNKTRIDADPHLPTIAIVREFEAPRDRVFRAWTDPDLVVRWLGPRDGDMRIETWDARTGGSYRYTAWQGGREVAGFYGSFHEVRPDERIVWTFTYVDVPDGVMLETISFEDLGDGRSRVASLSVMDTMEGRDSIIASGMEQGVIEGYEQLDALLAEG